MVNKENSKLIFNSLVKSLNSIYETISCTECKRKISLDHNCNECNSKFCAECQFQIEKTKLCKKCKKTNTLQNKFNRNEFIEELVDLIKLFEQDTSVKIIDGNFSNVISKENIGKIFDKDKSNVFAAQQVFATSTPNVNQLKKVNFNSDITMIPANKKEEIKSDTSKNSSRNSSRKKEEKSLSKRKIDSIDDNEKDNSKTKKAKVVKENSKVIVQEEEVNKDVMDKEEVIEDDVVQEKSTSKINEKSTSKINEKSISKINEKSASKINEKSTSKINEKNTSKVNEKSTSKIQEKSKIEEKNFDEIQEKIIEKVREEIGNINIPSFKLSEEDCNIIKDKIKEDEFFKNLNDKLDENTKLLQELKKEKISINYEEIQKIFFTEMSKIVLEIKNPLTSCFEIENIGKINFTIHPFEKVEEPKKEFKVIEIQTDEVEKAEKMSISIQTEELNVVEKIISKIEEQEYKVNSETNDLSKNYEEKSNIEIDFEKSNIDENFEKSIIDNSCVKSLTESNCEKSLVESNCEKSLIDNGLEIVKNNFDKILSQDLLKNVQSSKLSLDVENMFEDDEEDDYVDASSPRV